MKKKEFLELKTKSIEEIKKKIEELTHEIIANKLELRMGKVKDIHLINKKRKDFARLKTLLKLKIFEEEAKKSDKKAGQNATS